MPQALLTCAGGTVLLPDDRLVFVDRLDGGHLIVNPPRDVWERGALTAEELIECANIVARTSDLLRHRYKLDL